MNHYKSCESIANITFISQLVEHGYVCQASWAILGGIIASFVQKSLFKRQFEDEALQVPFTYTHKLAADLLTWPKNLPKRMKDLESNIKLEIQHQLVATSSEYEAPVL
ncbi:hypothetical protein HAX54_030223 [Datura stramonium]|uniref:Uncharacterized protein n=1 Tax=Datura stramonium TaxID=4076 RepID=A0ABS8SAR3_DATST|nr:hypothetical protein [Datura stramonium]